MLKRRIESLREWYRGVVSRVPDGTWKRVIVLDNTVSRGTSCIASVYHVDDIMQARADYSDWRASSVTNRRYSRKYASTSSVSFVGNWHR